VNKYNFTTLDTETLETEMENFMKGRTKMQALEQDPEEIKRYGKAICDELLKRDSSIAQEFAEQQGYPIPVGKSDQGL